MRCDNCDYDIKYHEIYGDWYFCNICCESFYIQAERLNPEDHIRDVTKMVCDSPNSCESMRGEIEESCPPREI